MCSLRKQKTLAVTDYKLTYKRSRLSATIHRPISDSLKYRMNGSAWSGSSHFKDTVISCDALSIADSTKR